MTSSENMGEPAVVVRLSWSNTSRALKTREERGEGARERQVERDGESVCHINFEHFEHLHSAPLKTRSAGGFDQRGGSYLRMLVWSDFSRTRTTSRLTERMSCCPSSMSSTRPSSISVMRPCIRSFSTPMDASRARLSMENSREPSESEAPRRGERVGGEQELS